MSRHVDVIIVGGGIAGTTLAWRLWQRGLTFFMLDDARPNSASRVAAGLVTPITGKRLNISYQWDDAYRSSDEFYRDVEQRLNANFWYVCGSARFCEPQSSIRDIADRLIQFPRVATTWLNAEWFDPQWRQVSGGFFMPQAARLDAAAFLAISHEYFAANDSYAQLWVDVDEDLFTFPTHVYHRVKDIQARYAICCRGYVDSQHRNFAAAKFRLAQGDVLRIRLDRSLETTTIHSQFWMTPTTAEKTLGSLALEHARRPRSDDWLLGSTYQWRPLDGLPSPTGRDSLLENLQQRLLTPYQVIDHLAGIRPSTFDQHPLLGLHPERQRLGLFNGLGAKGCYLGPWCADILVKHLFDSEPIPAALKWNR